MTGDGSPPDWTDDQVARASRTEIAFGRLLLTVPWRIAAHRRAAALGTATSTSVLSVDEFAALRSVGFEPVGQVMGSADVFDLAGTSRGCGQTYSPPWSTPREVPWPWPIAVARHGAVDGMRRECARLGGCGVVGVRLMTPSFPRPGAARSPALRRPPRATRRATNERMVDRAAFGRVERPEPVARATGGTHVTYPLQV